MTQNTRGDQPFFLYVPLGSPHTPIVPSPEWQGRSGLGKYGDFVMQTDNVVGEISAALEKNGITDNTLVIFTSDNGSFMFRVNPDPDYPFGQQLPPTCFYVRKVGDGSRDHSENAKVHGYYPHVHQANYTWRGTKSDIWEGGHRVPFIAR